MRCPDCQKFVSFDTETEPEVDLNVDDTGEVTGTARIVNTCSECSQELTEATLDVETSVVDDVDAHREAMKAEHEAEQATKPEDERVPYDESAHDSLTLDTSDGSRTDRSQTHDRHGKPITKARYARRFYGAEGTVTVTCKCGEEFTASWSAEVQASGMDSLV